MTHSVRCLFSVLILLFSVPALADRQKAGDIIIHNIEVRATTPNAGASAGYALFENQGDEPDRLIGASVAFAKKTEIHEMRLDGDVMKMRQKPDGLLLPANSMVGLVKGGDHLMFMGLVQPVKMGQRYEVVLEFEKAGKVVVMAEVISLSGKSSKGHDHKGHDHDHDHKGHETSHKH